MNACASPFARVRSLFFAAGVFVICGARAEPFLPKDENQVLEHLRTAPLDPSAREMRELRSRLAREPGNTSVAVRLAQRCIERSRAEGDPRFLGHAQSALTHWWHDSQPPLDVLVLRATIRQSQHDFTSALVDLETAVRLAPGCAQAWLTRATVLTVLGRYEEARRSCLPLVRLAPQLISTTAAANLNSLTGRAEQSCRILSSVLDRNPSAAIGERIWALTVLAESWARLGRPSEAENSFRRAFALGERDAYLLGAFADFLLDQGRAPEAAALLHDETRIDPLLLRLALAESAFAKPPASFESHVADLSARFESSRLRGDTVHRREEARFTLELLHRPLEALRLAEANWSVQREPADARVLLESALAASDATAAQPVLQFVRTNKLEDVRLNELAIRLTHLAAK